jgi:hypothetical protein
MNKLLTTLLTLSLFLTVQAQESDTVSCVSGPNTLEYAVHYNHQTCPDSCNGSALIEILQGSGNYQYSWSSSLGYSASHPDPDSLCPDDYLLVVQDLSFGIFCTMQITIDSLQPFSHSINTTNVSATGACDGTAELVLSGGVQPYVITWYDANQNLIIGEDSSFIDDLCAGNYFYQVGWNSNCGPADTIGGVGNGTGGLVPFSINEPLIVSLNWQIDETCFGWCDGMAEFSATGGSGNYTYDIGFGPQTNGQFSGLCGFQTYTVTVIDDLGGTGSASVFIMEGQMIQGSVSHTDVSCFGTCDGSITIIDGSWDMNLIQVDLYDAGNNLVASAPINGGVVTFSNLCAGQYTSYGTSFNGCYDMIGTSSISEPGQLVLSNNVNDESSNGSCDGQINSTISGGTAPYSWSLEDCLGNVLVSSSSSGNFTNLCAGCYTVCVSDGNGCTSCSQETVNSGCNMTATATTTDVTCNGLCDGTAQFNITGGQAPYSYLWCDGQTGPINQNLCAGICQVTIVDANGCSVDISIQINEPTALTATSSVNNVSCNGGSDGSMAVTASGGTGSYTYIWSPSISTTNSITGAQAGIYCVDIIDANNCTLTVCDTIFEPSPINLSLSQTDESGFGMCDGNITPLASGGTAPYMYQVYDCAGNLQSFPTSGGSFVNVCGGCYDVCVTDANGCQSCNQVNVGTGCNLQATSTQTEVTCFGNCDGSATIFATGGDGNYSYTWDDPANQTTATATGLCAGIYICTIMDGQGCFFSQTVVITEPAELLVTTNVVVGSTDFNLCDGLILSNVSGGNGFYTYNWMDCANNNTVSTSDSASNLCPGEYFLTVTDMNGCSASTTCDTIHDNSINSLSEQSIFEISVYPNPVSDQINLTSNETNYQVRLFDLNGKLLYNQKVNNNRHIIDLDKIDISKGMYHLQVLSEGHTKTLKIIVE